MQHVFYFYAYGILPKFKVRWVLNIWLKEAQNGMSDKSKMPKSIMKKDKTSLKILIVGFN